jgi:hypothetical protein
MQDVEHETLLDLHRELCAMVRGADQVFGRTYAAGAASRTAALEAAGYRTALEHVKAALEALDAAMNGGPRDAARDLPAAVECARQIC